jgi:hypothetical protein
MRSIFPICENIFPVCQSIFPVYAVCEDICYVRKYLQSSE